MAPWRVLVGCACLLVALTGCGQWYRDMQRSAWQAGLPEADPPLAYRIWKEGADYRGEVLILPPDQADDPGAAVARPALREPRYDKPWFTAYYDHDGERHAVRFRYHRETEAGLEATDLVYDRLLLFHHIPFTDSAE